MIRTVITPKSATIKISIPEKYIGKPLAVTFLPLDELESSDSKKTMAEFWGTISDKTAKILHEEVNQNRKEW